MTRFRNYLMAALGFAIFVLPLMILNSRPADAQIGPPAARPVDVRVTNTATSPVPTVVLNTPSIEGSVSVVNTPTVAISSAANGVRVERTEDLPARSRFQGRDLLLFPRTVPIGQVQTDELTVQFGGSFTVPAGKRFVLEHVSAFGAVLPGQFARLYIKTTTDNGTVTHHLASTPQGSLFENDAFVINHFTRAYADPGTEVRFGISSTADASAEVSFTGYYVDVP